MKWSLTGNAIPCSTFGPIPRVLKNVTTVEEDAAEEEKENFPSSETENIPPQNDAQMMPPKVVDVDMEKDLQADVQV